MPDEVQMPLFESETPTSSDVRREEERSDRVQAVQYCRFPRVYADQRFRTAFTRDISDSGLCVRVDEPEPIGALLRVIPRGVDGEPETERIGRVAWTRPTADGGRWLGIALLESGPREPVRVPAVRRPNPQKKQA